MNHEKIRELHPEIVYIEDDPIKFFDTNKNEVVIPQSSIDAAISQTNVINKERAKKSIDLAAGRVRAAALPESDKIVEEYRITADQTKEWRAAGSPSDNVPASVQAWATAANQTAEVTATLIEQQAQQLETLILTIRQIRLSGKIAVENASSNFESVAQPYIDQLNNML